MHHHLFVSVLSCFRSVLDSKDEEDNENEEDNEEDDVDHQCPGCSLFLFYLNRLVNLSCRLSRIFGVLLRDEVLRANSKVIASGRQGDDGCLQLVELSESGVGYTLLFLSSFKRRQAIETQVNVVLGVGGKTTVLILRVL